MRISDWFHRAKHREGQSVEELIDHLNGEILAANPKGWNLSADGKHYLFSGFVAFPKDLDSIWDDESNKAVIMIDAPGGVTNFPALIHKPCQHYNREIINQRPDYVEQTTAYLAAACYMTTFCSDCGQWLNEESIYG